MILFIPAVESLSRRAADISQLQLHDHFFFFLCILTSLGSTPDAQLRLRMHRTTRRFVTAVQFLVHGLLLTTETHIVFSDVVSRKGVGRFRKKASVLPSDGKRSSGSGTTHDATLTLTG